MKRNLFTEKEFYEVVQMELRKQNVDFFFRYLYEHLRNSLIAQHGEFLIVGFSNVRVVARPLLTHGKLSVTADLYLRAVNKEKPLLKRYNLTRFSTGRYIATIK